MRPSAVLVIATLLLAGAATPAQAYPEHVVADWELNEPAGAKVMKDSSGNGFDGTIGTEVLAGTSAANAVGYRFTRLAPDTPPTHPQHVAIVPDHSALNPGTGLFAVTIRVRTTYQFGNIVQKGQATVPGGNFKMELPNGIARCYFRGDRGALMAVATNKINDGNWHVVRCERDYDAVRLSIDGTQVAQRNGWVGRIANTWPLSVGGKTVCNQVSVGCDYFAGDLDYVRVSTD